MPARMDWLWTPKASPSSRDIYGNARIQDGTVDIGAVEGATSGNPAQIYVVTSLENVIADDGVLTFLKHSKRANGNQPVGDALAGSFSEQDVIQFADGLSGTVLVDDGELVIRGGLSIEGPGAESLTFDACDANGVFQIKPGVSANLSGMTITGGSAKGRWWDLQLWYADDRRFDTRGQRGEQVRRWSLRHGCTDGHQFHDFRQLGH